MRQHDALEAIAERRQQDIAAEHARHRAEQTALAAQWEAERLAKAQALQGPPEPEPPGGWRRTGDGGLQQLRRRCFWQQRTGKRAPIVPHPLP